MDFINYVVDMSLVRPKRGSISRTLPSCTRRGCVEEESDLSSVMVPMQKRHQICGIVIRVVDG